MIIDRPVGFRQLYFMLSRFDLQVQELDQHGDLGNKYELRELWSN